MYLTEWNPEAVGKSAFASQSVIKCKSGTVSYKWAEPHCDTAECTWGKNPNGVQDFRSWGTQESHTPKGALPQHFSCPETPSCSYLAPSTGTSLWHSPSNLALPRLCLVIFHKWQNWSGLTPFGCWLHQSWGSPLVPLPAWGWQHASHCHVALPAACLQLCGPRGTSVCL